VEALILFFWVETPVRLQVDTTVSEKCTSQSVEDEVRFSEMLVPTYMPKWHHNPEQEHGFL
jgi:hypothetical protein